jgi:predicted CXXCH cytochrome family protein
MTAPSLPPANLAKKLRRIELILAGLTILSVLAALWGWYFHYPGGLGPRQPIPFSHRLHAGTKGISCFFCHPGAMHTARAGVPPLETCLLCHSRIIVDYPEIVKLRAAYDERQPIQWARVNTLPDFVFFDHEVHVRAGFDCSQCHGDVAGMDRVWLVSDFQMGFCVQCHRDNGFSHDCFICHR